MKRYTIQTEKEEPTDIDSNSRILKKTQGNPNTEEFPLADFALSRYMPSPDQDIVAMCFFLHSIELQTLLGRNKRTDLKRVFSQTDQKKSAANSIKRKKEIEENEKCNLLLEKL